MLIKKNISIGNRSQWLILWLVIWEGPGSYYQSRVTVSEYFTLDWKQYKLRPSTDWQWSLIWSQTDLLLTTLIIGSRFSLQLQNNHYFQKKKLNCPKENSIHIQEEELDLLHSSSKRMGGFQCSASNNLKNKKILRLFSSEPKRHHKGFGRVNYV